MTARCLRLSLVSMSTTMEIAFDRSFFIGLLLLGSQGVPPCRRHPRFHRLLEPVCQTWTLFSASSFDRNFRPNNNQTFIVYMKSTLVAYRKGLCGFFLVLGFALEEKLHGAKCCKFYRPKGVHIRHIGHVLASFSKRYSLALLSPTMSANTQLD